MAHSYLCIRLHLVWSTYRRQPWIAPEWRDRLYRYLAAVARHKGAAVICAGGVADHVHLYVSLPASVSVARLVDSLKSNSSRWVHETFPRLRLFAWQTGYAAFSVYKPDEQRLVAYLRDQEAHHRRRHFEHELRRLLDRHGLSITPNT